MVSFVLLPGRVVGKGRRSHMARMRYSGEVPKIYEDLRLLSDSS
jgi:hypothetical protein